MLIKLFLIKYQTTLVKINKTNELNDQFLFHVSHKLQIQNQLVIKSSVDFLTENKKIKQGLSFVFSDQVNEVDNNKLPFLDSVTVDRNLTIDKELTSWKNVEDEEDKNCILRFNQALENHLKVSVGDDVQNLTIFGRKQIRIQVILQWVKQVDIYYSSGL